MDLNKVDINKLPADVRKTFKKTASNACRKKDTEQS